VTGAQELADRVAIVTGGTQGIGFAIAQELLLAGARVVVASRKPDRVEAAIASLSQRYPERVAGEVANAGDPNAAERVAGAAVERFGRLDILVNNAATNPHNGLLVDITMAAALKTAQVNLAGPVVWTGAARRAGLGGGGAVLNISSVGGLVSDPNIGFYNATKAGLVHLTRQLAYELGPDVRVNALAPGLIKTELARVVWEAREEHLASLLPLGRLGTVEDVAMAARFLVSDRASWITGQTLVLDGGALSLPIGVEQ